MAITNAELIHQQELELIVSGAISPEEEIHTYAFWKNRGRQVKKGEKAIATFRIWKPVGKYYKEGYNMTNEYWYAVQMDREDDWGTGSFDKAEAVKMAAEMDAEMIAVIKGDYVDGEPTTDPICVDELRKGEDFCGSATYYYYECEDFNGILVTDGYVAYDGKIDSNGRDIDTGIDVYAEDAVEQLKSAYTQKAREGYLYNFKELLINGYDVANNLMIFTPEWYHTLVELAEVI